MSLSEAEMLLQIIKEAFPNREARIIKLTHEWVIFLPARTVYIWNKRDWYENFAPKEKPFETEEEALAS